MGKEKLTSKTNDEQQMCWLLVKRERVGARRPMVTSCFHKPSQHRDSHAIATRLAPGEALPSVPDVMGVGERGCFLEKLWGRGRNEAPGGADIASR